jgi:hypothetical protein
MDLSLTFGRPMSELLDTVDPTELQYWREYHRMVGFGPFMSWFHFAATSATEYNSKRKKTDKALQARDFLPEAYR